MKTFIEIGSSYFRTLRHLCDKGWQGIMIDPIAIALDQIKPHPNLFKIQTAIMPKEGYYDFVKPKDEYFFEFDQDYQGSSTFNEIMWFWDQADLNPKVEKVKVYCTTFDMLCSSINLTNIDFLKIDAEGSDLPILESIDFNKYDIKMIKTEHNGVNKHLNKMVSILEKNDYFVEVFEYDIMAVKL